MTSKVSVIIPVFNMAPAIERAIKSVASQTHSNLELMVIDDGSTDDTAQVVKRLMQDFPELYINYLYQENLGHSAAINSGVQSAKGEFITVLDADDLLPKESLETRARFLEAHPNLDAVYSDVNRVDNSTILSVRRPPVNIPQEDLAYQFLSSRSAPFYHQSFMYRRSAFYKAGFFNEKYSRHNASDFVHRILKHCEVGYLQHVTYSFSVNNHPYKTELKNRLRSIPERVMMAIEHTRGLERVYLITRAVLFEGSKLLEKAVGYRIKH